jgi:natural product biosynthesis luciferase-like monooxygenase protein
MQGPTVNRRGITDYIELQLRAVLGLGDDFVLEHDREFGQYGMNSIAGARFCYVLSNELGREVSAKLLLDNYTIEKLARCLEEELQLGPRHWEQMVNDRRSRAPGAGIETGWPSAPSPALAPMAADQHGASAPEPVQLRKQVLVEDILRKLRRRARGAGEMDFSFIFFSSKRSVPAAGAYDYVRDIARFADTNGFKAIWVPERHFFEFGGLFPDPGTLLANLAAQTSQIRLRSGSVVLPLHHPTRVVESWSMLDHLSNGRVDMAFASGWNPNDFVSSPHTYGNAREVWFERMSEVERLWRGEAVEYTNGKQERVAIQVHPRPLQPRLNVWMAITGNEQSFVEAGRRGYNVLTMLMSKPLEELSANIARYRAARREAGFAPGEGVVSLMLHTFVHEDAEKVERCVREHYFDYIRSSLKGHIQSLPQKPTEEEIQKIVEHSVHHQRRNSALFGDVEHCHATVQRLRAAGVDEIACLVDFGISERDMHDTLPFVRELKDRVNAVQAPATAAAQPTASPEAPAAAPSTTTVRNGGGEFAIVGMAGRFPGAASVEDFWQNLLARRNCIREISDDRFDWRSVEGDPKTQPGKTNIRHFGLIDDVYEFDAAFFRISAREGELMDPHARLLLETVWQTIENAGVAPSALQGSRVGMFLSFYNDEYGQVLSESEIEKSSEPYLATALSGTIKANRVSFLLGLTGPSEVYDTACSSSLVALHRAMQAISAGDCTQAIVAGVSLLLSPSRVIALSKMGILNESAVCNPYSHPANREVIGEGVGALLIKPLAAAEADGDPIYAVVCGSDVRHQGNRSGHLTLPAAKALSELIDGTYAKLGLDHREVSYFEGHGSGNDSDVVELMALRDSFAGLPPGRRISLGSVKSNVGFGEASGGIAQLIKCALSLHRGVVPPTLHFTRCDPSFDLASSNVEVLVEPKVLAREADHHVSVLAYGLGGTNAHVVLRNHRRGDLTVRPAPGAASAPGALWPFVFSAGSVAALARYLQGIRRHLAEPAVRADLERRFAHRVGELLQSLACTLIRRERRSTHRLVVLAPSYDLLLQGLDAWLEGRDLAPDSPVKVLGQPAADATAPTVTNGEPEAHMLRCADAWLGGADVDWGARLTPAEFPRIALPPAPFAGKALRVPARAVPVPADRRLEWRKTESGVEVTYHLLADDYFVRDHRVDDRPVLPGVAYLAMLQEIAQRVFGLPSCTVRSIAWLMPFDLEGAASGTLQFAFDAQGQFRARHVQRNLLCCKGRLELDSRESSAAGQRFVPTLRNPDFTGVAPLLDREAFWSLVNNAEAKQVHGESMRSLRAIYPQADQCVAVLYRPTGVKQLRQIPLYDGALAATVGLALMRSEQLSPSVPFSIDAFHALESLDDLAESQPIFAVVSRHDAKLPKYDVSLESASGRVLAVFSGFFAKTFANLPQGPVAVPASARMPNPAAAAAPPPAVAQSLRQRLLDEIHGRIVSFLKAKPEDVPIDEGLDVLGLDSIGVNEVTEQLTQALGFELPVTVMFEYPRIADMADYLIDEFPAQIASALGAGGAAALGATVSEPLPPMAASVASVSRQSTGESSMEDIAVVGIGGCCPGSAGIQEFWQHLLAGRDLVTDLPAHRRDALQALFPDSMAELGTVQGGFVADAEYFDAEFFGLGREQALAMDPQQRLFLVACWQAVEDAGYYPHSLAGSRTGVYAGAISNEYLQAITLAGFTSVHMGTGGALSGIANRSSYFLDLHGPSQSIDAACCSSLYAVDQAVKDIRSGACEAALVGGVNYVGTPHGFLAYAGMNYLAKDWRCKAFAQGGDGWSKGELFAAVYLKPYTRALADGDAVYAVITASGSSHGGRSHFYEQPNSQQHAELVTRVLREGRVRAPHLVHIEAHGTGTEMGDALEFNVFQRSLKTLATEQGLELPRHSCAVGSVKSNIGHTEAAAGIAGFIKTVLLVHDRVIPPSLHIAVANPHLRLENSPLYLASERRDLPRRELMPHIHASVHSFNFSGAAAHVVVAGAPVASTQARLGLRRFPVCVSARSAKALCAYLLLLADHVESHPEIAFDALVHTLNASRTYFPHRLAVVVESVAELVSQWRRAVSAFAQLHEDGELGKLRYSAVQADNRKVSAAAPLTDDSVDALVAQWLAQSRFSWSQVMAGSPVGRVHLPAYPFVDRQLCFAVTDATGEPRVAAPARVPLVPALPPSAPAVASAPTAADVPSQAKSPPKQAAEAGIGPSHPVARFLIETMAELFGVRAADIDLDDSLSAYSFDSLTLVRLCDRVNAAFDLQLAPPEYFAFVKLADVAEFVVQSMGAKSAVSASHASPVELTVQPAVDARRPEPAARAAPANGPREDAIAVIGMSGAFPGATDLGEFFQVLSEGRDCIGEIPLLRWDWRAAQSGNRATGPAASRWGAFIAGIDEFDPLFFGISPREAAMMDPQQRLLLTHAWQTVEDAGYAPTQLAGTRTAVFVGMGASAFEQVLGDAGVPVDGHAATGLAPCIGPNRISFVLDLHGPSEAIDTACSSSLIAVHRAAQSLRSGECDFALTGGVNLILSAVVQDSLNSAGMLAEDGRCKTFSDKADGYVRGEGIGLLLLRRLADARRAGDHVYGLILGSAENHGGRANSLTAPNPNSQADLLVTAYRRAGIDPATVGYIEAHGTGTKLGDPIEVNGLKQAFAALQKETGGPLAAGQCGLGSVKTNIGHLEYAAGIAGVIKVLLQMRHRQLAKTLHCDTVNPFIALAGSPFFVVQAPQSWAAARDAHGRELPRRAGVSSFGFGGANAHVVLEEVEADTAVVHAPTAYPALGRVFVLSAPTEEQLRETAAAVVARIDRREYADRDLARIAFTLQVGRVAMEQRAAFVADDLAALRETLQAIATGQPCTGAVFRGDSAEGRTVWAELNGDADFQRLGRDWLAAGNLPKLLSSWARGFDFDWSVCHEADTAAGAAGAYAPRRISLPTHPFQRRSFWPKAKAAAVAAVPTAAIAEPAPAVATAMSEMASSSRTTAPKIVLQQLGAAGQYPISSSAPAQRLTPLPAPLPASAPAPAPASELALAAPAARGLAEPAAPPMASAAAPALATADAQQALQAAGAVATAPRAEDLVDELRRSLADSLYLQPSEISVNKPFIELGLDSVIAVEWMRHLNQRFGLNVPVTKLYDYPDVTGLAGYIAGELGRAGIATVAVESMPAATAAPAPAQAVTAADSTATPRGLVISGVRRIDELQIEDWRPGAPRAGEVTIDVRASAINFPDTLCVNGIYPTLPAYPFVPGFEVSGVVSAVGEGVSGAHVGDAVIAITGDALGGHAQQVNVPSQGLMPKPENITFEEACSLPVVFGTVYAAFALGGLRRGEHVLIQTATGGCGLMALQLARLLGAVCYGTSSRQEKLEILQRLQVPHALDYRGDFDRDLMRLTGGRGVDVVLNMVAGDAIQKGLNALAPSGRYLELAVHALRARANFDLSHLVDNQSFLSMDFRRLSRADGGSQLAPAFAAMIDWLQSGHIVPIVSRIYPFARIKEALTFVGQGTHIGKVVLSHSATAVVDCTELCIERMLVQQRRASTQSLVEPLRLGVAQAARPGSPSPLAEPAPARTHADEGIAVIGMAGQFPQAPDLATFWRNIAAGRDCIEEIPSSRWASSEFFDPDREAPGKSYCKWMGVVDDADKFDPLFFNISPAEAKLMDPQQRLFLQSCWHCIEDAGIDPETLSGSRCGVFVGCTQGMYGQSSGSSDLDAHGLMGGNSAILAARISYFLNLKGPSIAIDTACSSSLVAINEACNYLQLGRVDSALAGGVTVLAGPGLHIMTSKAGMLSPQGRCFTFDQRADGFVPGEGVGVILLKTLARARADGDPIHGIIRAWGVNQDGKTNGITAPSPASQIQLQRQVYEEFGISPESITLVEAHGTGTKLGDPIEVGALIESFRAFTARQHYCVLGSVKSNIGHALSAAGVAGVIKTLLALKHRQLPPAVHFSTLNEHISLAGSPFVVNTKLTDWPRPVAGVRRAAVSSFSFSGTNAHLVLDEAPAARTASVEQTAHLIVLSARGPQQLRQQAAQLLEHLATDAPANLSDISFTLLVGRKHFPQRLAVVASDARELARSLRSWLSEGECPDLTTGTSGETALGRSASVSLASVALAERRAQLRKLGQRYCQGDVPEPEQVLLGCASLGGPCRVSLPGYPFAKQSYWLSGESGPRPDAPPTPPTASVEPAAPSQAAVEPKQWVFIAEEEVRDPFPESMDWRRALQSASGTRLLLVGDEESCRCLTGLIAQLCESLRESSPGFVDPSVQTLDSRGAALDSLAQTPDSVIICGPWQRPSGPATFDDADVRRVFEVCRHFMRKAWDAHIRFLCFYGGDEHSAVVDCEALSGFLSSAAMENRHHTWALVACDAAAADVARRSQIILQEWLCAVAREPAPFVELRHRGGERWSTRLQAVDFPTERPSVFRSGATYLITGGLGPMGMLLCTALARRCRPTLVIFSRSVLDDERRERIRSLESLGAKVHYFAVDITDREALTAAYAQMKPAVGDIHGVMLLANQVQDGIVANKTWESFAGETATKTRGTLHIDRLTSGEPLEFFLLFSSVAAYGLAGSSGYSYGSAFQNAFARYRSELARAGARRGFSLSCCWGPWTVDYYLRQSTDENRARKFASQGTDLITIEAAFPLIEASAAVRRHSLGLAAVSDARRFSSLLQLGGMEVGVAARTEPGEFAWLVQHLQRWEREQQAGRPVSIKTVEQTIPLEDIRRLPPELISRLYGLLQAGAETPMSADAATLPGDRSPAQIAAAISSVLAEILELRSVSPDEPFQNYGLDSIVAMKLVTRLERQLQLTVEPKWLIDFPTVSALAAHLCAREPVNQHVSAA